MANDGHHKSNRKFSIECKTLSSAVKSEKIEHIDVLKIVPQGTEDEVISGAESILSDISIIYTQT